MCLFALKIESISIKEEQKEKEVIALDKSKFYNRISLEHQCLEPWSLKNKERSLEKSYRYVVHGNSSKSPFLNPSLLAHEVSYVELKFFLASYICNVSIIEDAYAISSSGGLVLVVPSISKYVSSHDPFKSQLVISEDIYVPSCLVCELAHDVFLLDFKVVGLGLDCASFDILHDNCLGKFVQNVGYFSSFLDTFMENHN
ncbi:hypothetical protein M9H77_03743 [Catharanthus roseus]|uniref:Uncharacterized protein n=1 Tax=Catharanthus roseus TaxID=4058 RepID=A0ACC0CC93_CATRO|nr:hypothetical protein M9H77_03743 [Catharanthus roseus]